MKSRVFLFCLVFLFLGIAGSCYAYLPTIIYNQTGNISINNPETSQAFFDQLNDKPRDFLISSRTDFNFYINILIPELANPNGRYTANIYLLNPPAGGGKEENIAKLDGSNDASWQEFYDNFSRDYYLKGPELEKKLPAGDYKVEISSQDNKGKYTLMIGKVETFPVASDIKSYLNLDFIKMQIVEWVNLFYVLPMLKINFFKTTPFELIFTPPGIIAIIILGLFILFLIFISFVISAIKKVLKRKPKMMLLTSSGMTGSKDDIMAILPKPADDIRVAHIITAAKYKENNFDGVERNRMMMLESGFNVEQFDIEGKNEAQLLHMLSGFDIIYVQGGNTFYLLKCMRNSGFAKVMNKLFRQGVIYVGESAGSIVMGRNIETAKWLGDENVVRMSNLNFSGLNFVPFNIFVHYAPEFTDIIKSKSNGVKKKLKILTDSQAIFAFGNKITFVGEGEVIDPNNL